MTEIILTSSVLILLLVILRRGLRGRIHPGVQYALWLLVAARLLIPGTLFTAPVTVVGAAEELRASIQETLPDPAAPPAADSRPAGPPVSALGPSRPPDDVTVSCEIVEPEITVSATDWPDVIWKTGMAVTAGALVLSNLAFYIRLRRSRRRLTLPDAPWTGKLPVYEADGIPSPCLFGVFRPAIYLNEAAMDAEHPEHILAHEYAHYRHGDHIWSLLRGVCLTIHWYNPLVWWAAALSRRDCELACDAAALRRLGGEESIDYGKTLLGMVSRRASPAALLQTATTMTAGKRAMQERLALIIRRPRMRKATFAAVALAACILVSCAFGGRAAAPAGAEPSPLMEFPGLHWNDGVETVLDTLGITREQILEQGELNDDSDRWGVVAENVSGFGAAAEKAYFYFQRYEGSAWGLYYVRLDYPDGGDFDAVREELIRQYGSGSETPAESYSFTDGGSLHADQPAQTGPGLEQMMLDIYGQETMDRRAEILEQPGPHSWYWSPDSSVLPEEFLARAPEWLAENRSTPTSPETAQEYFQLQPMVRVFWTDAAPLNWARLSTTLNQVCLDASEYVFFLQRIADAGTSPASPQDVPVAVSIGQSASSNSHDYAYITDPAEVARLWELYQSFAYEGSYDPTGKGGWPISVSFHWGDAPEDGDVFFILSQHGLYTQDGESLRLKNIDAIYEEFLRLSEDPAWSLPFTDGQSPSAPDPAQDAARENARSIVEQVRQGADPGEWLPLMSYMDWGLLAQAAVEAGLDEGDGSGTVVDIIGNIDRYMEQQGAAMTQAEYLYILSATEGLDGAPAEGYGSMIYRLYTVNPSQFACVVLEQLPEAQRDEALDLFRGEWMFHKEPYRDTAPTREEAVAQLEADLEVSVSASPGEMTLTGAGESFQFLPVNAFGVYSVACTSSDPGVATVDTAGTVTAVAPGQAVITMHYEGTGGPAEFTCAVTCEW